MTGRQRDALVRVVIICAAWALGETLEFAVGARALGPILPLILAAAAFMATRDTPWGGGSGDTYWRGRRIERDRWRN